MWSTRAVDETLPPHGWDAARTAEALAALGGRDVHWREGRAWSLVYSAGPEAAAVADDAYRRYGAANALNVAAFPSLAARQRRCSDRKSTRLNSSHVSESRMPSSA